MTANAGRDLAVGDALHLERMQFAEIGDLIEGQRGVLDEPNGRRLRHQRGVAHRKFSLDVGHGGNVGAAPPGAATHRTTVHVGMPPI